LLAPTVVLNGALWGQLDMLWALPLIAALGFFLRGNHYLSVALIGLAFSVKLQAIFLFPLLAVWLLRKQVPWRSLALIPAVFFVSVIPAWVAGVPLGFLLTIYPRQTGRYTWLNMHAPGIYNWLPEDAQWIGPFGIWLTIGVTFMLVVACARRKERPSGCETLAEALMLACLLPFLLPRMHERYVFLGDVLSIVYAFVVPRHAWLALLVIGASLFSYFPFLFGATPVPLAVAAMMLGAACLFLVFVVLRASYPGVFERQAGESVAGGNLPHDR
jgi:Gpi18-like mannosyltransferase